MHAQLAGCGLHKSLAAPLLWPPTLNRRPAKRTVTSQRASASSEEAAHGQATLQGRAIGLGLGLALSLEIAATPATAADAVQSLQQAAGNSTLAQTVQKVAGGTNPFQDVQKAAGSTSGSVQKAASGSTSGGNPLQGLQNAAGSASKALTSGPDVGTSLKDAFTKSPPQQARKGKTAAAATPDFIRGRFGRSTQVIGGVVLLLASSLLAAPVVRGGAPKDAAKGAKSQARKVSGFQPVQGARQLASKARSGGTQPAKQAQSAFGSLVGKARSGGTQPAKKAQSAFGSQLSRAKSGGPSKLGKKAGAAAKQAQDRTPSGGLVAGLAAAGLVAGGILFAVITQPNGQPAGDLPSSPQQVQDAAGAASSQAGKAGEAAAQKSGETLAGVPPQKPQGSTFELSLGTGQGPNSEPLNLRPSVESVDAPKPGGIPVFPPKGTSQQEAGSSAAPQEEGAAQESTVKPKGSRPQGDVSSLDFGATVREVDTNGLDIPNPFNSKGNPQKGTSTDQTLEPRGPAAEAQRSADQASQSQSDENRLDRDT